MTARNAEGSFPDDLDGYLNSLAQDELEEIELAGAAIDLAIVLHRVRERRALTQSAAAAQSGFAQQAISRLERPHSNVQLATLRRYLSALGYDLELTIRDHETGEFAGRVSFPAA